MNKYLIENIMDEEIMQSLGMRLATLLHGGDFIGLNGDLGAGKTTLVKGIAAGLGVLDIVTSPSYVLFNQYIFQNKFFFIHGDFYRIEDGVSLDYTGWQDFLLIDDTITVIEWSDKFISYLPEERLDLYLINNNMGMRDVQIVARGNSWLIRKNKLKELINGFNNNSGY